MKDANGKILSLGDKVHRAGRADAIFYICEINKNTVGVGAVKGGKASFAILPDKLVKFKNNSK